MYRKSGYLRFAEVSTQGQTPSFTVEVPCLLTHWSAAWGPRRARQRESEGVKSGGGRVAG